MAFPLTVKVQPEELRLRPGEDAGVDVTIRNVSEIVQHYSVSLLDWPSDNVPSVEPKITKLRPGETGEVRVRVSLPAGADVVAGDYNIGVLVDSPYPNQPEVSRCEELTLRVASVHAISITADREVAYGGSSAVYPISLANEGNVPLDVALSATDDEGTANFTFRPPVLRLEPRIAPHASVQHANVEVRARSPWLGQERRRQIRIVAADRDHQGTVQVTFVQKPRVKPGILRAAGAVSAVGVLAAAVLTGALLGRERTGSAGADEGTKTQPVPSVLGQPQQNAATTLEQAHFKPSVDDGCAAFNDQYASGQVYRQSPEGQTQATPSSTVTLCISKGIETVAIPDVRDRTPDEAKAQLEDLGFKVQVVDQASADVEKDHVIGTNPAAGANPKKGSTVKLLVSTGPEQVPVPSVVGKQRNDAENILRDAGFKVQIDERDAPDEQPGTVLDQSPGAGARVDPGTTVTLIVAKQPQQQFVTVRNVVGFTEDAAKQALENDGLKVKVQNQEPSDPTKPDGTVVAQSIQAGTQVAQDTEITIMVNHLQGG